MPLLNRFMKDPGRQYGPFRFPISENSGGNLDRWIDQGTGEVVESFAILTQEPSDLIRQAGHDRNLFFCRIRDVLNGFTAKIRIFHRQKRPLRK